MNKSIITLVTGNVDKLRELEAIFLPSLQLRSQKIDLDEIQSLELHEIVRHKLRQAYASVQAPVIIEDVSAELDKLAGLPGPFVKFFQQRLGNGALYQLAGESRVRIVCSMGYYDGTREIIVDGVFEGRVTAPRGGEGFGFDFVVIPDGYDQTMSELGLTVKNRISHRARACQELARQISTTEQDAYGRP